MNLSSKVLKAINKMSNLDAIAHLVTIGIADEGELSVCGDCDGNGERNYQGSCSSDQDDRWAVCVECNGLGII